MNWENFEESAKSEISQPNGTTGNTHIHPRSHSEQRSAGEKLSHTSSGKKKNPTYFHSGSLGNVWGFPCFHGDDELEFLNQRETEINNHEFSKKKR